MVLYSTFFSDSYFAVYSERSLVLCYDGNPCYTLSRVYRFPDWIQTAAFLEGDKVILAWKLVSDNGSECCNIMVIFLRDD